MLRPNLHIENLKPASHGGIDYAELESLGISPEDVLDFSVSTNPFGPPPGIKETLRRVSTERYPDSEATEFKLRLAGKLDISPDNLLIGSGSTELIRLVATAYLDLCDTVLIPQPTYSEYEVACQLIGARVRKTATKEDTGFQLDMSDLIKAIREQKPKAIFICNPNNPTGQYLSEDEVRRILSTAKDSLVVLDEAYIAFTENKWSSLDLIERDNVVILRSMTKDYALAGLRLGYAVGPEKVISVLKRIKPPWNVSSVAQTAGIFALSSDDYLETCLMKIKRAGKFLVEALKALGLSPVPSQTNFFLVKVGGAATFRQALLKKGILVRDCASFGLPEYIRLAPRTLAECKRLITAIRESGVCCCDC